MPALHINGGGLGADFQGFKGLVTLSKSQIHLMNVADTPQIASVM